MNTVAGTSGPLNDAQPLPATVSAAQGDIFQWTVGTEVEVQALRAGHQKEHGGGTSAPCQTSEGGTVKVSIGMREVGDRRLWFAEVLYGPEEKPLIRYGEGLGKALEKLGI